MKFYFERRMRRILLVMTAAVCMSIHVCAQLPAPETVRYEAEMMDAAFGDNQRAESKDASGDAYTWCEEGRNKPNYMFASSYYDIPQGRYRATWRLKVKSNTGTRAVARIDCTQPGNRNYMLQTADIKPSDFKSPGTWQDFTYEFERTEMGRVQYRGYFLATGDIAIDCLDIGMIRPFSDEELYEREIKSYPVNIPSDLGGLWNSLRHKELRILELKGAKFDELWRTAEAVAKITDAKLDSRAWTKIWHQDFKDTDKYFPTTYDELFAFDAIILNCGDVRLLQAVGRKMLCDYVSAGGRLIVLGGYTSYGKGKVKNTWAEKLFAVTVGTQWDLIPVNDARLNRPGWFSSLTDASARFPWPDGGTVPRAEWLHAVEPGPDAELIWECDGKPALVERHVGKGFVRLITMSQLGSRENGRKLFCDLDEWPSALAEIIRR